jgi:hypothetical protein
MPCRRRALLVSAAGTTVPGCLSGPDPEAADGTPPRPPDGPYTYTHHRASGNRHLAGTARLADADVVDIDVDGRPRWLLGFPADAGSRWTVVRADATAVTYRVADGTATEIEPHGAVAAPPVGTHTDDAVTLLAPPRDLADHTHPVKLTDGLLYVAADGDVVVRRGADRTRLDLAAPPDVRPIRLAADRYLVHARGTDRYRHAALGDAVEPGSLAIVDTATPGVVTEIELEPPRVFEAFTPLVADLDADGTPEIVTTVADAADGARIRIYSPDGTRVATGPTLGAGWRHQLAVAPYPPDGHPELAVVRKPHVDWTLEFYRLADGELTITATHQGVSSHSYGSRILDGGIAADVDAADRTELLVPTADRDAVAAVTRTADGTETAWTLPLPGRIATNLAGLTRPDGLAIAAGDDRTVRVWHG